MLPIAHARPRRAEDAIAIPPSAKRRLQLDDEQSWIVVSEVNEFVWPGPDLRMAGKDAVYGMRPADLVRDLRDLIVARLEKGRLVVSRARESLRRARLDAAPGLRYMPPHDR